MRVFLFSLLLCLGLFGTTQSALAIDPNALVTCDGVTAGGVPCDFCKFMAMVEKVVNFMVGILILISVIMLAVTGVQMTIAASDGSDARQLLKDRMTNIVIGFFLIIASWTIIDTLMKAIVSDGTLRDYWRTPLTELCGSMSLPGDYRVVIEVPYDPDGSSSDVWTNPDSGAGVTPSGNLVSYAGRQFDSAVVDNIRYIDSNFDLSVSSGYRSAEHNARVGGSPTSHHLSGRAGDFVGSAAEMERAAAWARANGAREVLIHNAGSGTHLHVAW